MNGEDILDIALKSNIIKCKNRPDKSARRRKIPVCLRTCNSAYSVTTPVSWPGVDPGAQRSYDAMYYVLVS